MSAIKLKNKIYIVLIAIVLIVIAIVAILLINNSTSKVIISNEESKQLINTNALTMMYETEAGSGEYQVSSDTTWPQEGYVFNEQLSSCENGSTLTWDDENKRVMMSTSVSDKCYVYFDKMVPTIADVCTNGDNLGSCIQSFYSTYGEGYGGLYYHDGIGTYTNADQEAGDNSYRYSGANPNNYVCFGSTETVCPYDNLYRIIGAFDDDGDGNYQIKLIKADYVTSTMLGTDGRDYYGNYIDSSRADFTYYKGKMNHSTIAAYRWNYDTSVSKYGSNNWATSELNTINLNTNYWNYLGVFWQSLISETTWHLGSNQSNLSWSIPKNFYNWERNNTGSGSNPITYNAEIGLMYASDYGYASCPDTWRLSRLTDPSVLGNNNWMYLGLNEWIITTISLTLDSVHFLESKGGYDISNSYYGFSVRPVFYINSDVTYISGIGTQSDPFRIA